MKRTYDPLALLLSATANQKNLKSNLKSNLNPNAPVFVPNKRSKNESDAAVVLPGETVEETKIRLPNRYGLPVNSTLNSKAPEFFPKNERPRDESDADVVLPSDAAVVVPGETVEETKIRLGINGTGVGDNPDLNFVRDPPPTNKGKNKHFMINEDDVNFEQVKKNKKGNKDILITNNTVYRNIVFNDNRYARYKFNPHNCWIEYEFRGGNDLYFKFIICPKNGKEFGRDLIEALIYFGYKFDYIYLTPAEGLGEDKTKTIQELVENYKKWGFGELLADGTQWGETDHILQTLRNYIRQPGGSKRQTKKRRQRKTKRKQRGNKRRQTKKRGKR